eukprot:gene14050-biopygen3144
MLEISCSPGSSLGTSRKLPGAAVACLEPHRIARKSECGRGTAGGRGRDSQAVCGGEAARCRNAGENRYGAPFLTAAPRARLLFAAQPRNTAPRRAGGGGASPRARSAGGAPKGEMVGTVRHLRRAAADAED